MDKNTVIKITNRNFGRVGYKIPEMGIQRQFMPRETKEITFEELEKLSFLPGGLKILKDYLVVKNKEAIEALNIHNEPEYFYTKEDIKRLFEKGTLNEFLDCLDFAPDGVLDEIKEMAVTEPLNDMSKREAILEKLNFNVTKAIEIQNTKFDGDSEESTEKEAPKRRAMAPNIDETGRRTSTPKYKVVDTK